jgi:hypothetical protein
MIPFLLPFFRWADAFWLSREIRASTWQFAILEMIHLLGLTMLLGTLMVVDLRLFGFGMRRLKPGELARDLSRWMWLGLWVMLISGVFLFFGEPMKLYGSASFHVKMLLLFLALVFQVTLFRRVVADQHVSSGYDKFAGFLSLFLWFGVGLAGRGIGFL